MGLMLYSAESNSSILSIVLHTMKQFVEIGIGNRWLVRTEFEKDDGTEYERRGIHWPSRVTSLYVRLWIGRRVVILDTSKGVRLYRKPRRKFKLVLGIQEF